MNGVLTSAPASRQRQRRRSSHQPPPLPGWLQFTAVLLCVLQFSGQITSSYDERNRLAATTYTTSVPAINSERDYAYDGVGNMLSVTEPSKTAASVAYGYDPLNRAVSETSNGLTHAYTYDAAGNRLTTVYGGTGRTITSTYDALNRLTSMQEQTPAEISASTAGRTSQYGYDLNGNIVQKTAPNGDTETYSFDAINRATVESAQTGGASSLFDYTYGYDLLGNVLTIGEQYPSGLNNRTVTNTYDSINRLLVEAVTGAATNVTTTYTYDNANNRSTMAVDTAGTTVNTSYSYNNLNQLTSYSDDTDTRSVILTYDYNGNRYSRVISGSADAGTDIYSYDIENRMVGLVKGTSGGAGTYAYQYDYRTRRITRDESSAGGVVTHLVFSGGTSVQEYDGSNTTPTVEYVRGSDYGGGVGGILYTIRNIAGVSTPSYTHANKRGDIVAKTNATGALTYQAQYAAFGNQTQTQGTTTDRQKSNSKDTDPTNMVDEGMRYRDLETGMFITRDPAGFVDGPNLYTYVVQNPWTSFDPEGLETKDQLQDQQKALDEGYQKTKDAINSDKNATDKEKAAGLASLDETYHKHQKELQKRIDKIDQTARDVARANGGKAEDYESQINDTDPKTQELMRDLEVLDNLGLKDSFLDGYHGDFSSAAENALTGVILNRITEGASSVLKILRRTSAENKAARQIWKNNKDKGRKAWEKKTGQEWPTDENGQPWPAEHKPPLKEGGDPMEVTPRDPGAPDPHNIPGPDGKTDYQRWGAEGPPARGANSDGK